MSEAVLFSNRSSAFSAEPPLSISPPLPVVTTFGFHREKHFPFPENQINMLIIELQLFPNMCWIQYDFMLRLYISITSLCLNSLLSLPAVCCIYITKLSEKGGAEIVDV